MFLVCLSQRSPLSNCLKLSLGQQTQRLLSAYSSKISNSLPEDKQNCISGRNRCVQKLVSRQLSSFTCAAEDKSGGIARDSNQRHVPVMPQEIISVLKPKHGQVIVDLTFGAGGHAREILKIADGVKYFASDRDPLAHGLASEMAASYNGSSEIIPILSRFSEIPAHLEEFGVEPGTVDAFLMDLGASSMQFDQAERGFSISRNGPLDMRMDSARFPGSATAADVVNNLDPADLANILKKYGEERKSRQIAQAIVEARYAFGNFVSTKQLAEVIKTVFESGSFRHDKLHRHAHVATKTFQALRIFVNDELNELHAGLEVAAHFLRPGSGTCAVLSFHSLEDRIVKRHFHGLDLDASGNQTVRDHFRNAALSFDVGAVRDKFLLSKPWLPVSKKVLVPTDEECEINPRARSAKLRAAVRVSLDSIGQDGVS